MVDAEDVSTHSKSTLACYTAAASEGTVQVHQPPV